MPAATAGDDADALSIEDLCGAREVGGPIGGGSTCNFVDANGNLNRLGQIQLGYLKAKCLCKLKRYSESLF